MIGAKKFAGVVIVGIAYVISGVEGPWLRVGYTAAGESGWAESRGSYGIANAPVVVAVAVAPRFRAPRWLSGWLSKPTPREPVPTVRVPAIEPSSPKQSWEESVGRAGSEWMKSEKPSTIFNRIEMSDPLPGKAPFLDEVLNSGMAGASDHPEVLAAEEMSWRAEQIAAAINNSKEIYPAVYLTKINESQREELILNIRLSLAKRNSIKIPDFVIERPKTQMFSTEISELSGRDWSSVVIHKTGERVVDTGQYKEMRELTYEAFVSDQTKMAIRPPLRLSFKIFVKKVISGIEGSLAKSIQLLGKRLARGQIREMDLPSTVECGRMLKHGILFERADIEGIEVELDNIVVIAEEIEHVESRERFD